MSISIHIPFYNTKKKKKEGFRQLTRFDFLRENIDNLKKLSIKNDIFIHTHNNFLDDKNLNVEVINHNINSYDLEKGHLTWLSRSMMSEQKDKYKYYMYLEHDIKFTEKNLNYMLRYQKELANKKFHLGFLIYEKNHNDNKEYCIHVGEKLRSFIKINSQKFFINDLENYCCFWIYDQSIFKKFIKTDWWTFKKKLTNFRHNYGITERAALGYHALNINFFKATLLPEINNKPDPDCFVEHITNNYFDRFSDLDKNKFNDIRGVCKYDLENAFDEKINQKEIKDFFIFKKFLKSLIWKLRFLTRLIKK